MKKPFHKCGWCKVTPRPESEKFYPPGWEPFQWGLRVDAMCPVCIKALTAFLKDLKKKPLDTVAT